MVCPAPALLAEPVLPSLKACPALLPLSAHEPAVLPGLSIRCSSVADSSRTIGPVADKVREQHQKTSDELSNLYASRQTPNNPTATGQPLTHYHSFFSELLSWNNPRT